MLRVQTILYNERLWMPTRSYDSYGSFQRVEQLPVTIPVSVVQEQFKPFVIAEEHLQEPVKPRSLKQVEKTFDPILLVEDHDESEEDAESLVEEDIVPLVKENAESLKEERAKSVVVLEEPVESVVVLEEPVQSVVLIEEPVQSVVLVEEPVQSIVIEESLAETSVIKEKEHVHNSVLVDEHSETESIEQSKIESIVIAEQEEHTEPKYTVAQEEIEIMTTAKPAVLGQAPMTIVTMDTSDHESQSDESMLIAEQETSEEEGEISPVLGTTSILSSASSSFAPVTPTSIESPLEKQMKSNTKGSLFRRETSKLNHKRRSLTMKLKSALSHSNKRNSM
ncbi:unnamed protein product [Rhizopus stolonifer]